MPSIRETMEAVAEQDEAPEAAPADETPLEAEPSDPGQDSPPEKTDDNPEKTEEPEKKSGDRARAPDGKFAPKPKEQEGVQPGPKVGEPAQQIQQTQPKVEALRAPQSWKPEHREKWASVPRELQEEISRRENETSRVVQESAEARRFHSTLHQSIAPLQGVIAAHGVTPEKYLADVTQQLATLNFGNMDQKAHIAASLIASHGINEDAVVKAFFRIKGRPIPGEEGQQSQPQAIDPEAIAQQAEQRVMARVQAQGYEQLVQRRMGEIKQFIATKNPEHWNDVLPQLSLVFAEAERTGQPIDLDEVYSTACMMNPSVRTVLQQREQEASKAKQAETARAATQRAKAAGVSVKSTPAGSINGAGPKSLRAQLEAAAANIGGQ